MDVFALKWGKCPLIKLLGCKGVLVGFKFKYHKKRVFGDIALFLLAVLPALFAFFSDSAKLTTDLFLRSGAIMALFATFLEFRTHEIQIQKQEDKFKAAWKMMGQISEALIKIDNAAKIALRNQATVIEAAGMEPEMGKAKDIKDMVLSEEIKALRDLQPLPNGYYKYNEVVSFIGKVLVILGTLIWAFGDLVVKCTTA